MTAFLIFAFLLCSSSVFAQKKQWERKWDVGESRFGVPADLTSNSPHHTVECGTGNFIDAFGFNSVVEQDGERFHRSGISDLILSNPCADTEFPNFNPVFRDYPSHGLKVPFNLPILFRMKVRLVSDSYDFAKDRFSQLTTKGKSAPADGQIITTHILPGGYTDIGHSDMTFQDKDVLVPLKRWHIQSLYIYQEAGETFAVTWIDTVKAVEAICKANWASGQLRDMHAGSYFQEVSNYPIKPFFIDNDNFQLNEVSGINEVLRLISESVAGLSEPDTTQPFDVKIIVTWEPNTESDLSHYDLYWGLASRDYTANIRVSGDSTSATIIGQMNKQYFIALTAVDFAGNESELSDEVVTETKDISPPNKPKIIEVKVRF